MPLSDQGRAAIDLMALSPAQAVGEADLAAIRADLHIEALADSGSRADGVTFADVIVGSVGRHDVAVRIYGPAVQGPGRPAVLFMHGGGWAICDVDTHHELACQMATDTGCVVVSVEYRLAPDHPFPAPLDDCVTAARWLSEHADELQASPAGIVVAGDSAGGNLAAALAVAARDGEAPHVLLQVLIYPVLDADFETASWAANGDGRFGLSERQMRWYWDQYAAGDARANPLAAPARAIDLGGLAPAFIGVGELDPLRDGARIYAARLQQAGVAVTYREYDGGFHGFYSFRGMLDIAAEAAADVAAAICAAQPRRALQ
jgi:acetyl esterase